MQILVHLDKDTRDLRGVWVRVGGQFVAYYPEGDGSDELFQRAKVYFPQPDPLTPAQRVVAVARSSPYSIWWTLVETDKLPEGLGADATARQAYDYVQGLVQQAATRDPVDGGPKRQS